MLDLDIRRTILQLKALGHGVRAIARTLRISRNAVRTVLAEGVAEVPKIERAEISAAHLDTLRILYTECQGNRVRVWEEAQKQGIAISYLWRRPETEPLWGGEGSQRGVVCREAGGGAGRVAAAVDDAEAEGTGASTVLRVP